MKNPALISGRDASVNTRTPGDVCPPGIRFSEQVESRSRSLPRLNNNTEEEEEEEEEYSNQFSSLSFTPSTSYPPTPLKRVTCHTYSLHDPRLSSSRSDPQVDSVSRANPLYQASEETGGYAEVPPGPTPAGLPDDTYEQIPEEAVQGNMYESLDDMKTKKSKSTWGKNVSETERSEVLLLFPELIHHNQSRSFCFLFAEHEMEEVPS